jgi:hypothetical protein
MSDADLPGPNASAESQRVAADDKRGPPDAAESLLN